jgi:hypothetical protein
VDIIPIVMIKEDTNILPEVLKAVDDLKQPLVLHTAKRVKLHEEPDKSRC